MRERNKYTLYGAAFGAMFPIIAFIVITFFTRNINILFYIICSAPLFLGVFARFAGVKQDEINEVNRGLEDRVRERTAEIKNLMDVSGQGFLSFGADYAVKPEYSRQCQVIFGGPIEGKLFHQLLFEDEVKREEFINGMDLLFQDKAKPEVIFNLMEKECSLGDKTIRVEYRSMGNDQVLCALTDVTLEKQMEQKIEEETAQRNIIFNVITHKKYFAGFIQEAAELFDFMEVVNSSGNDHAKNEELQRKLHTLKGNASFFKFEKTTESAHELEFYIADRIVLDQDIMIADQVPVLKKAYYQELQIVKDTLGDEWITTADAVLVPKNHFQKIESYVNKRYKSDEKLRTTLAAYRKVPFRDLFVRFPAMAEKLAGSLGKAIEPMEILGGEFSVDPDRYESLVSSCVHLLRNMVDHGIEPSHEREVKNKDPKGSMHIAIEQTDHTAILRFSDDGQGISLQKVRQQAIDKGLLKNGSNGNAGEILALLFHQGFSTAKDATETSGRGVGLAALQNEVKALGGKIKVATKVDQGTTISISLPMNG